MSITRLPAALFLLLVSAGCGTKLPAKPFTIGQLIPLSGPDKVQGEHARNGARLAVEAAVREGREVSGRSVIVRHVDDRSDVKNIQAMAIRLLTLNDVVAVIGGPGIAANEQLARAARSYGVPVLLPADLPVLPVGEAVFCLNVAPEVRGEALARFAIHDLHYHRIVVLSDSSNGTNAALATAFVREWRQGHHDDKEPSIDVWSYSDESTRKELASRLETAKPDAMLLAVEPREFLQLRSQFTTAGLKIPLLYGGEDKGISLFEEDRRAGPVIYIATAFVAGDDLAKVGQAFVQEYRKVFGERPDMSAALAYDGVRLLIEALIKEKTAIPSHLRDALSTMSDFPSVTGPLRFANRRAKRTLFIVTIQDGRSKVLQTFGPEIDFE